MRALVLWWRALTQRRRFEQELDEELAFHRDARRDDLVAQGASPLDATRQATLELGMTQLHRDDVRCARGLAWVDTLVRDLRYAVRGLRRNRGYSFTALCVLGIAIAANAVLFGLFNAYALRAPPLERVERWVTLRAVGAEQNRIDRWPSDQADALVRDPPAMFEGLYWLRDVRLQVEADVVRSAFGEAVSDNYFELLGIRAAQGRLFRSTDRSDDPDGVVLSDLGWQRLTASDPGIVGRRIVVSGRSFTVLGVTAPEFTGTTVASALFWLRERDLRALRPDEFDASPRVDVGGFLRADASRDEAAAAIASRVLAWNGDLAPDAQRAGALVDRRTGYLRAGDVEELVTIGAPIGIAFVALLLVAAANLANLVLARFAARKRELAVRAAVGASRRRMLAQLLTECLLLAAVAAVCGFALATAAINPLHNAAFGLLGNFGMELRAVSVDAQVFCYALGMSMLAALTFGGVPALLVTSPWRRGSSARPDMAALQRTGHARLRNGLMVAQLAASVVLVVLAALIAGNARVAEQLALGYDPSRVVALQVDQPTAALQDAMALLPQVEAVAAVARIPLMGDAANVDARIGDASRRVRLRSVGARYFDVLALDVKHGRGFTRGDERGARVVVVSQRTADTLWPGRSPLGQTLDLPPQAQLSAETAGRYEVIGVVADAVSGLFINGVDQTAVYLPRAVDAAAMSSVVLRVHEGSRATLDALARTCVAAEPLQNCDVLPLEDALRLQHVPFLVAANIAGALGWTALAISCLGLYGLASYLVLQKRREIGVRLALGATSRRVVGAMLAQSARQIALGLGIGVPLAYAAARAAASVIESLRTLDAVAFVLVPLLLGALALLAAWIPTRRIAAIAPTEALRDE